MFQKTKILIVDDQRLFRQSLKCLLELEPDMEVVAEATNGQDAFTYAQEKRPDVILMDVDMPKLDGIRATHLIMERFPNIKVLILSVHDEDYRIIAGINAGAIGYILKDADHNEFIRIIRGTMSGEKVISPFLANLDPSVLSKVRHSYADSIGSNEEKGGQQEQFLTQREKEILDLIVKAKSNKEIADLLCISLETVKSHLQNIYKKLGIKSRIEAALFFLKVKENKSVIS